MKLKEPISRPPYLLVSASTVTVLGIGAAAAPPRMLMFGWVALGPALAAASARTAVVLAVGGYAFVAGLAISTWQGLLGSADQILRLLVLVCITAIATGLARHQERLQRDAAGAAREREMLAALAEQSADAIIGSTLDGVITAWNAGAERMYGYRAEEVIGRQLAELLPPDRAARLPQALERLAAGEQVWIDESERLHSDGTSLTVSVVVFPIRDQFGLVVGTAATERDITGKKRRETEERLAKERSERAARLESLGQLAGGVAHDFNNLLAIILNYADFLAEEVSEAGAADLARIRDAADRARSLTGQLLLFAKREPTQVEIVDLNDVVTEAGDLLSRTIGANIRLGCRPRSGRLPVRANRGRLDQILLNLVVNARDAMPDGGDVLVETGVAEMTGGPAEPLAPGRYAVLSVRDTGVGMTAEVRDRLFEPFFTTKPPDQGTGLGLATVYGIVGDACGHIGVESQPGAGTTFRILLPLATTPGEVPDCPAPAGPAQGHGERVVVVDDDDFVRDLVVRILRENGYRTSALSEEALAGADLHDAALLVVDVVLRGRSGPEVAGHLRHKWPTLRVLLMSGYNETDLRTRYGIPEAITIVQKPFTAIELLGTVGEALAPAARPPARR
ncbi:PAS domain S-box protein [Actinoplanes sp. CA-142083]|uniref:two-component system sensor histidine kinase NtrB n=1 Tax=Actinoplanes sp. CA-142083 TaxID=3239903 RepID=UPI003D8D9F8A